MRCDVKIDAFEGPLDLLLHLIKTQEMDIYDIPVVEITEQYLVYLDTLKEMNLEIAGEFLLMTATLLQIKSRMLLPPADTEEEEELEDPRTELVLRLLEYQKYRDAADQLSEMPVLSRDFFVPNQQGRVDDFTVEMEETGIYELVAAFRHIFRKRPLAPVHYVYQESLSVARTARSLLTRLNHEKRLVFHELFSEQASRQEFVVSFLAILELVRLRMVKVSQADTYAPLWLFLSSAGERQSGEEIDDSAFNYA